VWGRIIAFFAVGAGVAWFFGGLFWGGAVVALFLAFLALVFVSRYHESRLRARLEKEGQRVKAWIVTANENLYLLNSPENMWKAQVVFTTQEGVENLDEFLADVAGQLREFKSDEPKDDDERIISEIVRTQIGYHTPLLVPRRLTGKIEAYTVTVDVGCEMLPDHKLTKPYIYCRVIVNPESRKGRVARMTAYPKGKSQAKKKRRYTGPLTWEEKERS
jgi:hypothetical protein